jgi:hypothetical protein
MHLCVPVYYEMVATGYSEEETVGARLQIMCDWLCVVLRRDATAGFLWGGTTKIVCLRGEYIWTQVVLANLSITS